MALFKTDYEKGILQPTTAGQPQLATPRANYFLLVSIDVNKQPDLFSHFEEKKNQSYNINMGFNWMILT